ncbi:hypothetical protein [Streptomyces sp. NPDC048428]|uniref:hypothetical protein n=1 Tax=Streptomyces sp. NPDC048428 TaxID=3154503 RepID=UPI003430A5A6
MSPLFDLAGQLAPHFSFFLGRMVDGVMDSAVQRIADRSVDAGEGAFRSLVGGDGQETDDAAGPTAPDAAELDRLLSRLTDTDRARLAAALATWLNGPPGRHDLVDLLRTPEPAPAPSVSVTSRGDHNTVIGSVGTFNQHPRDDRP